jgi:hypothetical protein
MKILRGDLLLGLAALVWLAGCASIGPPLPPSLELPKAPSDLHATRKGDKVRLTWTIPARTTDRQRVRYLGTTSICRSHDPALKQCGVPVGSLAPPADFVKVTKSTTQKTAASFVDRLPSAIEQEHPTGFATYAVEVLNTSGRGAGISNQVHVPLVPTLPPFAGFTTRTTDQGVLLTWQCVSASSSGRDGMKYVFRIYRRPESGTGETRIAAIDTTDCAEAKGAPAGSFLDRTFEWEKTYFYRGAVVSVIEVAGKPAIEVEGDDTPEVKVFAHDVFPPAVPSGLQAVYSGAGQEPFIDLILAPVPDSDLEGYNVYRHEEGAPPVKVNAELVKAPAFRDTQVEPGATYFYSASSVDQRGNESARSEEASERVP